MKHLLSFIIDLADVALIFYFVYKFLTLKVQNKNVIFGILVFQTLINTWMGSVFGAGSLPGLIVMLLTTTLFYRFLYKEELLKIITFIFLALILMFVAEAVGIFTMMAFGIMPMDIQANILYYLIIAMITKPLYFIVVHFFLPKLKGFKGTSRTKFYQLLMVCIFNLIIILMAFFFYRNSEMLHGKENAITYIVLVTLGAIIFSIGILSLMRGIIKQSQKEAEWLIKETEYKRQMFYTENMNNMLKSISAQRHDYNNHINCIYGLVKLNKFPEALSYIENLVEDITKFNYIIDIENPFLSSLVNAKLTQAQHEKVYMEADVDIPVNMDIQPIDLCIIIGNLLDNAIEACRVEDIEYKYIELDAKTEKNKLVITVSNSKSTRVTADLDKLDERYTSKSDKENHGFGLMNIKEAVEKYDGKTKMEDLGDRFEVHIEIPVKDLDKKKFVKEQQISKKAV